MLRFEEHFILFSCTFGMSCYFDNELTPFSYPCMRRLFLNTKGIIFFWHESTRIDCILEHLICIENVFKTFTNIYFFLSQYFSFEKRKCLCFASFVLDMHLGIIMNHLDKYNHLRYPLSNVWRRWNLHYCKETQHSLFIK